MFNAIIYDPYQNGKKKRLRFCFELQFGNTACIRMALTILTSEVLNEQFSSVFIMDDGSELPHMEDIVCIKIFHL